MRIEKGHVLKEKGHLPDFNRGIIRGEKGAFMKKGRG